MVGFGVVPNHRKSLPAEGCTQSRWINLPTAKAGVGVRHLVYGKCQIHIHRIGVSRGASAALSQGLAVVGQASGQGVSLHPVARFLNQIGNVVSATS